VSEIRTHTALRGIAALLVVIFHFRTILVPSTDLDAYTHFFAKGYLWVDCFFILSGFILCYVYGTRPSESRDDCNNFLWARFARIYPLHLATLLGLAAIQLCIPRFTNQTAQIGDWNTFFLNLINIQAWGFLSAFDWNFPSWSISVEFAAYLTFPLICIGLVKARRFTTCAITSALALPWVLGHDNWERLALYHGLPMFFAGILIFQIRLRLPQRTINLLQLISIGSLVAFLHFGLPDTLVVLCFAVMIYSTQFDSGPARILSARPLLALGTWSYSIYMLHIPVRIVASLFLAAKLSPPAFFVIVLASTIALGAASYRLFEMPVRRKIMSGRKARTELQRV
jgi:peptidoglycan/LPS O-acetylase OafA/YrhL